LGFGLVIIHVTPVSSAQLSSAQPKTLHLHRPLPEISMNLSSMILIVGDSLLSSDGKRTKCTGLHLALSYMEIIIYNDNDNDASSDGMDEKRTNPATFAVEEHNLHFETAVMNDCRMTCSEH